MSELRILNNLQIVREIDNVAIEGKLICSCGCEEFHIYHTGKQTKGIFAPDIVKNKGQIIVEAKCTNCNETQKVLDTSIDGIKTKEVEQIEFKKLIIKDHIDTFKIIMKYNYYKEDYKTNKFIDCFIDVSSNELKSKRRIYEG